MFQEIYSDPLRYGPRKEGSSKDVRAHLNDAVYRNLQPTFKQTAFSFDIHALTR